MSGKRTSPAKRKLPFVFAGSSAASAGAAAILFVPPRDAGPAQRLLVLGAVIGGTGMKLMERKLGFAGEPYKKGTAGRLAKAARALTVAGAAVTAVAGRKRTGATVGAALVLAGGMCLRWSVYKAGFQSARDPRYTVELQRRRLESARD